MRRLTPMLCLTLLACAQGGLVETPESETGLPVEGNEEDARRTSPHLDDAFRSASQTYDVPAAILKAYAYAQTRYEMVSGAVEFEGVPARVGVMALTPPDVEEAAKQTGLSPLDIQSDADANIHAAAALLRSRADALGVDRAQLGAWAPAIAQLSALATPESQTRFVRDDVFGALEKGVGVFSEELAQASQPLSLPGEFGTVRQALEKAPDYPAGVWRPSPNHQPRPLGISMVVIHTCEGFYEGCIEALSNPTRPASAHYVVKGTGEVAQLVEESRRAWHVGAYYDCNLNGRNQCGLQNYAVNDFAIGIEHEGFASQPSFPEAQLASSARLLCDITRDRRIPRDRYHVVAHATVQPYDRTDPGKNWPWADYFKRADAACGIKPPPTCVIKGAIKAKYDQLKGESGPLGKCKTDERRTPDNAGAYNHFERGSIHWHPKTGAFAVLNGIKNTWASLGWEKGPLGYPITDERVAADKVGRFNHFQNGSIYWHPKTGAFAVLNGIKKKWAELKSETGPLGYPTTNETKTANGGAYNHFQHGSIYWHPRTGAFSVRGAIKRTWSELKSELGELGYPTSDEVVSADKVGRYNHFQNGSIYWHPKVGAFAVVKDIRQKWLALKAENGPLGYPTKNSTATASGGRYSHFQNGSIYWHPRTGAFAVLKDIRKKWSELGWENGSLGYPTTDQLTSKDGGAHNDFEKGSIYWHPSTGAFVIRGGIKKRWEEFGSEAGKLGYPVTDESPTHDGLGRYNHFQNGSIYWHPQLGAFVVTGEIRDAWKARDWERGPLGYPVADEVLLADGVGSVGEFQHGAVVRHPEHALAVLPKDVFTRWRTVGASASCLGYPVGDAVTAENGAITATFQGGTIHIDSARLATDSCSNVSPTPPEPERPTTPEVPTSPGAEPDVEPLPAQNGGSKGVEGAVSAGCSQAGSGLWLPFVTLLLLLPLGRSRRKLPAR